MLKIINGDLFNSDADILVNAVNAYGNMGGGIAKQFALRWPEMEQQYKTSCERGDYKTNACLFWHKDGKSIANLNTMDGLLVLKLGLFELKEHAQRYKHSISMPWIGCGIAGYPKEQIRALIQNIFDGTDVEATIYEV